MWRRDEVKSMDGEKSGCFLIDTDARSKHAAWISSGLAGLDPG